DAAADSSAYAERSRLCRRRLQIAARIVGEHESADLEAHGQLRQRCRARRIGALPKDLWYGPHW
ncbi:unnamed protein product, partial [marine sediment metagenome]